MQSMFASSNASTEYASYSDGDNQPFDNGVYRQSAAFNYFPNRHRQSTVGATSSVSMYDNGGSFPGYGMSAAEVFGTHQLSQQQQANDLRGFDYVNGPQKVTSKPIFTNLDPFGANGGTTMLQSHQNSKTSPTHQQAYQQQQVYQGQSSFINGALHAQAHSQTPFGPHLSANGIGASLVHSNGAAGGISVSTTSQEEISTIFVVGFPEDMQVCLSDFKAICC